MAILQLCGGGACPEQYDVYRNGENVGYLRLRHGGFRAECRGETVYTASPHGDGIFDPEERDHFLNEACQAILAALCKSETQTPALYEMIAEPPDASRN